MQRVLVLANNKQPLMPCSPARARQLLKAKNACVFRASPFTILLFERDHGEVQDVELNVDPGSKTTGVALVTECKNGRKLFFAANLSHRGNQVKQSLEQRSAIRRSRGNRKTRYRIGEALKALELPISFSSGGLTKYNRTQQGYPKEHWIDAACVGERGNEVIITPKVIPISIQACGRGSRQMCRVDRFGFPRTTSKQQKQVQGFKTGDLVKAIVTKGKKQGIYRGRVAVRATGNFNIKTQFGTVQGINAKYCHLIQRSDGYNYTGGGASSSR